MDQSREDLSFLEDVQQEQDSLERLHQLVVMHKELEDQKEDLEDQMRRVKDSIEKLEQEEIPAILHQNGLSRVKLKSGEEIKVQPDMKVSIPSGKFHEFMQFVQNREEDDIIKLKVEFDKMEAELKEKLYQFLNEQQYPYNADYAVHPQTLKKYVKDITGLGANDYAQGVKEGRYIPKEQLPGFIRVFEYFKTKIS